MKYEYQNSISAHIDNVHKNRNPHGNRGISHYPKQSGAGIVHSDKGNGCFYNQKVSIRIFHNILFNIAEETVKHCGFTQIQKTCNDSGKQYNEE